jgi:hypothetical protein
MKEDFFVGCKVLTVVKMSMLAFSVATPYGLAGR